MKNLFSKYLFLVSTLAFMSVRAFAVDLPPVAGVSPDSRPVGAPAISTYEKGSDWYKQALHGIEPPYPYSFKFLESQGAWHTPFNHPGMLSPYDIRGWHE